MDNSSLSWKDLHVELQDIMRQELDVLRNCLNLLSEQEQAFLLQKKGPKNNDLESMKKKMVLLRKKREEKTKQLTGFRQFDPESQQFEDAISKDFDNSSETLTLWSQILSLIDKIGECEGRLENACFERPSPQKLTEKKASSKKIDTL